MFKPTFLLLFTLLATLLFAQEPPKALTLKLEANVPAFFSVNHRIVNPTSDAPETTVSEKVKPNTSLLIKVEAKGYQPLWRTLSLQANETLHVETFTLEPCRVPCLFTSPNGKVATLQQRGRDIGKTPCYILLEAGKEHTFKAFAEGYHAETITVNTTDGRAKVYPINLRPSSAALVLSSTPSNAEITVNGIAYGTTPFSKNKLQPGPYAITFTAPGYRTASTRVEIVEGEEKQVHMTLDPLPATLRVVTIPEEARVYVDGIYRGRSNLVLTDFEPSAITVSVEKPAYAKESRPLILTSGEESFVEFRLEKLMNAVTFTVTPAEVDVYINKKHTTTTTPSGKGSHISAPVTLPLPVGKYTLTLDAKYYKEKTLDIEVKEGTPLNLGDIHLTFEPNIKITLKDGRTYTGALIEENAETLRVMTRPGMIMPLPVKNIQSRERINVPSFN
jgi:hypothetical protein